MDREEEVVFIDQLFITVCASKIDIKHRMMKVEESILIRILEILCYPSVNGGITLDDFVLGLD